MNVMMTYLRELQKHNERTWFQEHKQQRQEAEAAFEQRIALLMERLGRKDPSILGYEPKELTFKQVRDTRFSKDKTPYLPAFRAHISARGKLPIPVGYYLYLAPDNQSFFGGGLFADMFPDATSRIRKAIAQKPEEFAAIIQADEFQRRFQIQGTKLKNVPKGYDKEHPMAEYLKHKSWCLEYPLSDEEVEDEDLFLTIAEDVFTAMMPFHAFLNEALRDFQFPERP